MEDLEQAKTTAPELEMGFFHGEQELVAALRGCIIHACNQGASTLMLCDTDFALWPLSDDEVLTALKRWANSTSNQRTLTMFATSYKTLEAQHSQWVRWRQTWEHRVQCKQVRQGFDPNLPCIFWSDNVRLTMQNKKTCAGDVSENRQSLALEKLRLKELERQCSSGALPASTTGLW